MTITSTWERITPAIAQQYLEANVVNRSLQRVRVRQYAHDMAAGQWRKTHQGIAFDNYGRLSDGQHRLAAIIEAGVAVQMLVTHGLEPEAQENMDRMRSRRVADFLEGQHKTVRTAAARDLIALRTLDSIIPAAMVTARNNVTDGDMYEFFKNDPLAGSLEGFAKMAYRARLHVPEGISLTHLTVACAVFPELAEEVTEALAFGVGLQQGDPVLAFRNHRNSRVPQPMGSYVCLRLFHFKAIKRSIRVFDVTATGALPISIP